MQKRVRAILGYNVKEAFTSAWGAPWFGPDGGDWLTLLQRSGNGDLLPLFEKPKRKSSACPHFKTRALRNAFEERGGWTFGFAAKGEQNASGYSAYFMEGERVARGKNRKRDDLSTGIVKSAKGTAICGLHQGDMRKAKHRSQGRKKFLIGLAYPTHRFAQNILGNLGKKTVRSLVCICGSTQKGEAKRAKQKKTKNKNKQM